MLRKLLNIEINCVVGQLMVGGWPCKGTAEIMISSTLGDAMPQRLESILSKLVLKDIIYTAVAAATGK